MSQSVQFIGALLVLASCLPARLGRFAPGHTVRLWLRFVGASLITMDAFAERQWGFLLLGGACALYALTGLVDWARGRPAAGREPA
ncbi:hypothetical protein [Streptomyces indicus]|uniref:CBU-0592-like domain-containing protein n=1 Tax=Streptomyces indicus TaxID=417292 RepID=A0A1G9D6U0_9ACTN|nr:hypothetical protein [Streptomyces indicus]SDK59405.1 hypothetical protein SAMN05421806_10942 [Streptomyces indicus]